ncbi:hypothetical protein DEO72_LG11g1317 [Vigna unguiculata]|uniref:Ulp1 protease family n=1 Tax=Vigna unguiculata TaxID=3917 RepID=A0A4D6NLY9_VIGUN|nr:hypothetical protein DEO72_LG11g1317 [Vigna unguiculata]
MARKGKKEGKKADVEEEDRVRLINFVDTKHIVEINNVLTDGHRRRIGLTPFKWCLELERFLDICSPLLVELLRRWDEGVVGEEVEFDVYGCGLVGSLFCGERICIKEDQCNELVRVALNLGGISEAGDRVSEGGDVAGVSNTTDVWLKKFNSNEMEIIEIKKRLKILEVEVFSGNENDSGVEDEAQVGVDGNGKSPTLHDVPDNIYEDNPIHDVHCSELLAIVPWVEPIQENCSIRRVDVVKLYRTLFAPIVHDDHWWCYAVKLKTMEFFVLNSLGHGRKKRMRIDNNVEDLQQIRQNLISEWILHEDNENKEEILLYYDLYLR